MHRIIRVNFLHRLGFSAGPQSAWTLLLLLLLSPPLVFEYPVLPPITTSRETPRVSAPLVLPAPSPPAQTSTQGSTFRRGVGVGTSGLARQTGCEVLAIVPPRLPGARSRRGAANPGGPGGCTCPRVGCGPAGKAPAAAPAPGLAPRR